MLIDIQSAEIPSVSTSSSGGGLLPKDAAEQLASVLLKSLGGDGVPWVIRQAVLDAWSAVLEGESAAGTVDPRGADIWCLSVHFCSVCVLPKNGGRFCLFCLWQDFFYWAVCPLAS